jgi:hypothetical protein
LNGRAGILILKLRVAGDDKVEDWMRIVL